MFFSVDDLLNDIESYVHTTATLELDIPGVEAGRVRLKLLGEKVFYGNDEERESTRGSLLETRDYAYLTLFTPVDESVEEVRGWTCWVNEQGRFEGWRDSAEDVEAVMRDRSDNTGGEVANRCYPDDRQQVASLHRRAVKA